ncbi:DUF2924 domain-containing protein [Mesorhizobium sp. AR02]|uniref:DUF2924 domain-containing protein n=1 Tax=Mesorhizobium sp. AR02 TaxID=2865837 RepID=UPI00215E705D|nr:DUF2924 domain-containing protein [Mesorhizobium sp. AR02]UVK55383.1 DUF2924 domain-containing protein [Mesorhizobium sp. AR02]
MIARKDLENEIAGVGDLDRGELVARWTKIFRCPPPPGVRRELLAYAIAADLQAKRLGGLSSEGRKTLKLAIANVVAKMPRSRQTDTDDAALGEGNARNTGNAKRGDNTARTTPQVGARLIRDWNGRTNVVDVVKDGFLFEGTKYRSLSAIARKITGAHWSGPRFFGL